MSIRTTLILAVVVALLGALYLFGEKVKAPDEDVEHPNLVSVKPDDVTAIDLTTGGTTLTLEKKEGVWLITTPFKGLAGTKNVQNLVSQLTAMQADRIVNEDSTTSIIKQYGLDKPQFVVRLHVKGDAAAPTVSFGIRAPSETGWYVRVNDTGPVLLAGNAIAADILRGPQAWRESAPLLVDNAVVDRVATSGAGVEVELGKAKDKPEWSMTKPRTSKADAMAVNQWLGRLQGVEVKKFFDEMKPDDPKLAPTYTLKLWNKDQRDPMVISVGEKTEGGWYAVRAVGGVREVFLLPEGKRSALDIEPTEVADKNLFPDLDVEKAARAKMTEAEAGEARAEKTDGTWSYIAPAARKDELGKVTALLYTLKDMKYEHKVTDPKMLAAAKSSLTSPKAVFEITDDKGTPMATLTVGGEAPNQRRFVHTRGDDIYTADAAFANDWKANILALKNTAPVTSPSTGAAPAPLPPASPAAR